MMSQTIVVATSIDDDTKRQAKNVLESLELAMTDFVRDFCSYGN